MRSGSGPAVHVGEERRPILQLEGDVWGLLGGWPILRGNVARFPLPHLRHFPERVSAVRVVVLEARRIARHAPV